MSLDGIIWYSSRKTLVIREAQMRPSKMTVCADG